jgi:hypothetical protein
MVMLGSGEFGSLLCSYSSFTVIGLLRVIRRYSLKLQGKKSLISVNAFFYRPQSCPSRTLLVVIFIIILSYIKTNDITKVIHTRNSYEAALRTYKGTFEKSVRNGLEPPKNQSILFFPPES